MSKPEFDREKPGATSMFDFLGEDGKPSGAQRKKRRERSAKPMPTIRKPVPISKSGPLRAPKPGDPVAPPPPLTTGTVGKKPNKLDFLDDTQASGLDLHKSANSSDSSPPPNNVRTLRQQQNANSHDDLELAKEFDTFRREKADDFGSDWNDGITAYHPAADTDRDKRSVWIPIGGCFALLLGGAAYFYSTGQLQQWLPTLPGSTTIAGSDANNGTAAVSSDSVTAGNELAVESPQPIQESSLSIQFREQLATLESMLSTGAFDEAENELLSMDRTVYGYGAVEFADIEQRIANGRLGASSGVAVVANPEVSEQQQLAEQAAISQEEARIAQLRIDEAARLEAVRLQEERNQEALRLQQIQQAEQAAEVARVERLRLEREAAEQARIEQIRLERQLALETEQARAEQLALQQAQLEAENVRREQEQAEAAARAQREALAAEAAREEQLRLAEQQAARVEAQRQAELRAAQLEAQRQAELQAQRLEAQRQAELQAAQTEAQRLAEQQATLLEARRQAEQRAEAAARQREAERIAQFNAEAKAAELRAELDRQRQAEAEAARVAQQQALEVVETAAARADRIRLDALEEVAREEARRQIAEADRQATDRRVAEDRAAAERRASREQRLIRAREIEAQNAAAALAEKASREALTQTQVATAMQIDVPNRISTSNSRPVSTAPARISDEELQVVYRKFTALQDAIKDRDISEVVKLTERSGIRVQQFMQVFENSAAIDVRIRNVSTSNATGEIVGTLQIRNIERNDGSLAAPPADIASIRVTSNREGSDWSAIKW